RRQPPESHPRSPGRRWPFDWPSPIGMPGTRPQATRRNRFLRACAANRSGLERSPGRRRTQATRVAESWSRKTSAGSAVTRAENWPPPHGQAEKASQRRHTEKKEQAGEKRWLKAQTRVPETSKVLQNSAATRKKQLRRQTGQSLQPPGLVALFGRGVPAK